jgi:multidrug efflux pump subunit AcrA (membrane-fusion protein)
MCNFNSLIKILIILILNASFCYIKSYGQKNIIEKSKGTWVVPIKDFKEVRTIESRKREKAWVRTDSSISFICDSPYNVYAVHNGTVAFTYNDGKEYSVTTKFGDYFIYYGRLQKPLVKVGDLVKAGQIIARLGKDKNEMEYQLDMSMMKHEKSIDTYKWFKW